MLYIITALYLEAQPFIVELDLTQDPINRRFPIYKNDQTYLLITGSGELNASIGVTYLLTLFKPGPNDLLLNFGLCAAKYKEDTIGSMFLCHKLHDHATGRDYYPDMMISLPFLERSIETCPIAVGSQLSPSEIKNPLIDMESYAIMYSASYYMQPHQFLFLKVVSDHPSQYSPTILEKEVITNYLNNRAIELLAHLRQHSESMTFFSQLPKNICLTNQEQSTFEQVANLLHLTHTMKETLLLHIRYLKSRQKDCLSLLLNYSLMLTKHPCKNKTEGKPYYEQLLTDLME